MDHLKIATLLFAAFLGGCGENRKVEKVTVVNYKTVAGIDLKWLTENTDLEQKEELFIRYENPSSEAGQLKLKKAAVTGNPLAKLKSLKKLSISNTKITDVSFVLELPLLEVLVLFNSKVSDISGLSNIKNNLIIVHSSLLQPIFPVSPNLLSLDIDNECDFSLLRRFLKGQISLEGVFRQGNSPTCAARPCEKYRTQFFIQRSDLYEYEDLIHDRQFNLVPIYSNGALIHVYDSGRDQECNQLMGQPIL